MDATMEAKLRELLDREEIRQVYMRYGRGLDRHDIELVRSCYFDDAIEDHFHFVGNPDDFIDWAIDGSKPAISHQHNITNSYCDLDGDDAHCETYHLCVIVNPKPPHMLASGRYVDHFQRRNGEWRIANRVVIVDRAFDLQEAAILATLPPAYGPGEVKPSFRDRKDVSYQRPLRPRQPREKKAVQ